MKCCARCKTPGFGCANHVCSCHGLIAAADRRVRSRDNESAYAALIAPLAKEPVSVER